VRAYWKKEHARVARLHTLERLQRRRILLWRRLAQRERAVQRCQVLRDVVNLHAAGFGPRGHDVGRLLLAANAVHGARMPHGPVFQHGVAVVVVRVRLLCGVIAVVLRPVHLRHLHHQEAVVHVRLRGVGLRAGHRVRRQRKLLSLVAQPIAKDVEAEARPLQRHAVERLVGAAVVV
jgi:hypothetical protein